MTIQDNNNLSHSDKLELLRALEAKENQKKYNKLLDMFPDDGPFARHLYPKHLEFMAKGKEFKERAFIAGNRVGKSTVAGCEMAYHLTGLYPTWWEGKRFDRAITAIAAGKNHLTTRNIIQNQILLGGLVEPEYGTGLIPKNAIIRKTAKAGVPEAILDLYIKHVSGGTSHVIISSYEQGRAAFEGITADLAWIDEEPEPKHKEIYTEILVRLSTTDGILICTFTPLDGISEIVESFLPGGMIPDTGIVNKFKYVVMATWDDVPHFIDKEWITSNCLPHELEARSKGIPSIGAGKIYPIAEDDILVDPFTIPFHWPKMYGLDPGWGKTGALWATQDPNNRVVYIYDEYYRSQAEPAVHSSAIKARGEWITGVIDYAGASQTDGIRVKAQFVEEGLNLYNANKAVDAGILACFRALTEGRLKVFRSCPNWLKEFRVYRYDTNGKIVKKNDHLMDPMRYIMMSLDKMDVPPSDPLYSRLGNQSTGSNKDIDTITGY